MTLAQPEVTQCDHNASDRFIQTLCMFGHVWNASEWKRGCLKDNDCFGSYAIRIMLRMEVPFGAACMAVGTDAREPFLNTSCFALGSMLRNAKVC